MRGSLEITIKGKTKTYHTPEAIFIAPNIPHIVQSPEGCKIIAITIPADEGFPDVK